MLTGTLVLAPTLFTNAFNSFLVLVLNLDKSDTLAFSMISTALSTCAEI